MKQRDFIKLALVGLSTGVLVTSPLSAADAAKEKTITTKAATDNDKDPNEGNLGYYLMTEDELKLQLSPKGIEMYNSLDSEGKALALLVASQRCDGSNECAGLNACETPSNKCAGKGKCKGQGKCALGDKDLAVKLVRDKMAQKRSNLGK